MNSLFCRQRRLFTIISFTFIGDACLGIRAPFTHRIELPTCNSSLWTIRGGASSVDTEEELVTADESSISDLSVVESMTSVNDEESSEQTPIEPTPKEDSPPKQYQTPSSVTSDLSALKTLAFQKRAEGKAFHDSGDLSSASEAFHEAASLFQRVLKIDDELSEIGSAEELGQIVEDFATCRLHEALCLFKDGKAEHCIWVCSDVLGDDVRVGSSGDKELDAVDETDGLVDGNVSDELVGEISDINQDAALERKETVVISSKACHKTQISSQVRARAHLRRSKARLALGDLDGALEDAKQSAFMGDRNAVSFYGRLLREGTKANEPMTSSPGLISPWGNSDVQNSFLQGMMGGPGSPSLSGSDVSSSLLSSMFASNNDSPNGLGLMGDLLAPSAQTSNNKRRKKKKNGMDSLAKSVLSNIVKRMEDKDTQKAICRYLHSANTQQLMAFASMAGITMKEESAARLVGIAKSITPKGIRRSVRNMKRGVKVIKTTRKVFKVIDKYKTLLVLAMLYYWIRAAIFEPFPIDKRKAKAMLKGTAMNAMLN